MPGQPVNYPDRRVTANALLPAYRGYRELGGVVGSSPSAGGSATRFVTKPQTITAVFALALQLVPAAVPAARAEADPANEVVVLLHGLVRTDRSMRPLEARLAGEGFVVRNLRYPSTKLAPEQLGSHLHEQVVRCCGDAQRLHFVTHSLGGLMVRAYVADHSPVNIGRVVMLAPPNHGSELVDVVGGWSVFRWVLGPTWPRLGTDATSFPNSLPTPTFVLGVIAGTRSINPVGSLTLPGEDDGAVSVQSARIEGMSDFVEVPASHTFIMRSDAAADQVVAFLRTGRFRQDDPQ